MKIHWTWLLLGAVAGGVAAYAACSIPMLGGRGWGSMPEPRIAS